MILISNLQIYSHPLVEARHVAIGILECTMHGNQEAEYVSHVLPRRYQG